MSHHQQQMPGHQDYSGPSMHVLQNTNDAQTRSPFKYTSPTQSVSEEHSQGGSSQQRSVARAACLNCRSAKRRCDGNAPVCGPCVSRGIEAGGCNFVSSKRGGPRYKGVKGSEAAKIKADKDQARGAGRTSRGRSGELEQGKHASDAGSSASRQSDSPPVYGVDTRASFSNGKYHDNISSKQSPGTSSVSAINPLASNPSVFSLNPGISAHQSYYETHAPPYIQTQQIDDQQHYYRQPYQQDRQSISAQPLHLQHFPSQQQHDGPVEVPLENSFENSLGGPLSFANLELWQRIQEGASDEDIAAFSDFYSRLEMLPKAGVSGVNDMTAMMDPMDVLMDWEGGEIGNNVQDNEQGARTLLSDYYEIVYPSCPVLLSPGNLPSLAFYFSGKGPCGLFAAISSIVSLHLPPHEAVKTLKNSQAAMARLNGNIRTPHNHVADEAMTTQEIAAYHAKTSELILHQFEEARTTCFMDATCPNPFDGMDDELLVIEAAAAHTLLCHYYYGSGQPLSHQRAYKHAVEAWKLVQKLDLLGKAEIQDTFTSHPNAAAPFTAELKLEWTKRVYWASYAAATVMSCTGGFTPFGNPKDEVMDLRLRPNLEHDVAAWGVMVRGAQQVSRTYRLLYDLDQLRAKLAIRGGMMNTIELHQAAIERQTIFNAMLKLDSEIGTYTRFDPSWRNLSSTTESDGASHGVEGIEVQLAKSLKTAGRLMTSGAIIILHRAQAFSNARVFMRPQCGIPEAVRVHKPVTHDVILHRAAMDEGPEEIGGGGGINQSSSDSAFNQRDYLQTAATSVNHHHHHNAGSTHPFLTDRFAGGPFEPSHALERCRFAASAMISTLPGILGQSSPKLPPYSACSFVLGAYAILMLTLLIQVHGEEAELQNQRNGIGGMEVSNVSSINRFASNGLSAKQENLKRQLAIHRAPVRDIITVLNKFALVWKKANEYQEEVSTLLAANEIIG
ncbi:hypothetical protein CBS101457_006535 [Exobasidium rhododendri]|nr:hypothetical protein CBS101457_006535 [Exobasidium rhododendri]